MEKPEGLKRVGKTHWQVVASRQVNSNDRFPAVSWKSRRTQPDPLRTLTVSAPYGG